MASRVAVEVLEGKMEEDQELVGTVHLVVDLDEEIQTGQRLAAEELGEDLNSSPVPI